MGLARGYILPEEQRSKLRTKLEEPCPHCYFCGSPYVCILQGEKGITQATCLVCNRSFQISHTYRDLL